MIQKKLKSFEVALGGYFQTRTDIAAVYLFGSHAEGAAISTSDIDIAILYMSDQTPRDRTNAEISLNSTLMELLKHPNVDVHVITTTSSLPFIHEVLRSGRRVVINDIESTARFEAAMQVRYLDYRPVQLEYLRVMEERLQRGTYGNR